MTLIQKTMHILVQNGRGLEWGTSLLLLSVSFTLALPGDTVGTVRAFSSLYELGLNDALLAWATGVLVAVRGTALVINGSWHPTPEIRKYCAMLSAAFMSTMGVMLFLPYSQGNQEALGPASFMLIAGSISDVLASYRSAADGNR